MRTTILPLLALPTLTLAQQQQIPLFDQAKNLYNKAASYVPGAASIVHPVDSASAKVAQHAVHQLGFHDWRDTLKHSGETWGDSAPENWMVYVTGGNKTCGGRCARTDKAWNESTVLLQTDKTAPSLAQINCDADPLLCSSWAAATASIWFFQIPPPPSPDQSPAPTIITIHRLNTTSATNADVTRIHTQKLYLEKEPMESALHPFQGWIGKRESVIVPLAYAMYGVGKVPSWMFMLGVTLFSRLFVGRKMTGPAPKRDAGSGAAAPAPAGAK